MHVLVAGDVLQARLWATDGDQAAVTSLWFQVNPFMTSGPTDQDAANAIDTALSSAIRTTYAPEVRYNGCQVTMPLVRPLPRTVQSTTGAGPGTSSGITMGRQLAAVVTLQTDFSGPRYRGRIFHPFPPAADDATGGTPSAAYLTALTDLYGIPFGGISVTASGGAVGLTWVLFHRSSLIVPRVTEITNLIFQPKFGTQKRRGSYGRQNRSPI